jgi:polyisoprenoid-binding protein YceI
MSDLTYPADDGRRSGVTFSSVGILVSPLARAVASAGFALLLRTAAGARPLPADEVAVTLDPERTTIAFSVGATLHTVHGSFKLKSGALRFDTATGEVRGEVIVDMESGESGNTSRDKRMREEILEIRRFPTAVFRPDRFEGRLSAEGDSQGNLHGRLELHGADHELLFPVKIHAAAGQATAAARFEIPYVQWGVKNPSTFLLHVNDRVELQIQAAVDLSPRKQAAAIPSIARDPARP